MATPWLTTHRWRWRPTPAASLVFHTYTDDQAPSPHWYTTDPADAGPLAGGHQFDIRDVILALRAVGAARLRLRSCSVRSGAPARDPRERHRGGDHHPGRHRGLAKLAAVCVSCATRSSHRMRTATTASPAAPPSAITASRTAATLPRPAEHTDRGPSAHLLRARHTRLARFSSCPSSCESDVESRLPGASPGIRGSPVARTFGHAKPTQTPPTRSNT